MKKSTQCPTTKRIVTAIAALGFIAIPVVQADQSRDGAQADERRGAAQADERRADGQAEERRDAAQDQRRDAGQADQRRAGNQGQGQREPLKTEVTETFVDGYTVPEQYRMHFTEVPKIEGENVVVRYHNGRAFYVNNNDWKIVRIVELDSAGEVSEEDKNLAEGQVIPENRRTRFIEVSKPEADSEVNVRYLNNTVYYMDSNYRIVRSVRLTP